MDTFVVPVTAIEVAGFNAIPDAMAQELSERLRLPLFSGEIVQSNKVAHTRSNGWHRLVTPATFTGAVEAGADYLLVDDHVGFGGTFANLRGHIEAKGGHVLAMTATARNSKPLARCMVSIRFEPPSGLPSSVRHCVYP